ncbi:MAG: Mur ligase domain-containing protein, partial [Aestuariivirga sp.]
MTVALSHLLKSDAPLRASDDVLIHGVTDDSRTVKPGYLFVALSGGKADGATFIDQAFVEGAAAVVAAKGAYSGKHNIIAVENPRRILALAASRFYDRQPAG